MGHFEKRSTVGLASHQPRANSGPCRANSSAGRPDGAAWLGSMAWAAREGMETTGRFEGVESAVGAAGSLLEQPQVPTAKVAHHFAVEAPGRDSGEHAHLVVVGGNQSRSAEG